MVHKRSQNQFRKKWRPNFVRNRKGLSRQLFWQSSLLSSCEDPKQAWDALKKHFKRDTLANKLFLKKKYFRTEMKEGTSMEQHLKYMKDIVDKLAAIGAPISEEDQVVTLLESLPRSYALL
jgi:hypothetical protein